MVNNFIQGLWDTTPVLWVFLWVLIFQIIFIPIYRTFLKKCRKANLEKAVKIGKYEEICACDECENKAATIAVLIAFTMWLLSHYC